MNNIDYYIAKETIHNLVDSCDKIGIARPPKDKIKMIVREEIKIFHKILNEGLDIGGIVEQVVPVGITNHEKYGLCFTYKDRLYQCRRYISRYH